MVNIVKDMIMALIVAQIHLPQLELLQIESTSVVAVTTRFKIVAAAVVAAVVQVHEFAEEVGLGGGVTEVNPASKSQIRRQMSSAVFLPVHYGPE